VVAYPCRPSWAAVGEQVTAGYGAFFFSLNGKRLSARAQRCSFPRSAKSRGDGLKLLSTYATPEPEMDDDDREQLDQFRERFLPLADELATIFP
jgi:hypothetical protein